MEHYQLGTIITVELAESRRGEHLFRLAAYSMYLRLCRLRYPAFSDLSGLPSSDLSRTSTVNSRDEDIVKTLLRSNDRAAEKQRISFPGEAISVLRIEVRGDALSDTPPVANALSLQIARFWLLPRLETGSL